MRASTVTARCKPCGTTHPLAHLAQRVSQVSDGVPAAWCPTCKSVTPLDIRRLAEVPA